MAITPDRLGHFFELGNFFNIFQEGGLDNLDLVKKHLDNHPTFGNIPPFWNCPSVKQFLNSSEEHKTVIDSES